MTAKNMASDTFDIEHGFFRFVANVYSEARGLSFQIMETLNLDTTLKGLELIKPEHPDCTFSVTRYVCERGELPASKGLHARINDVLVYVTTCEKPGDALQRLIGYRPLSQGI
jgi:hypothetical protein